MPPRGREVAQAAWTPAVQLGPPEKRGSDRAFISTAADRAGLLQFLEGIEHLHARPPKVTVVSCDDRQAVATSRRGDAAVGQRHA